MSRVRISPTEWRIEEPATVHIRARSAYSIVSAEVIGSMRPTLTVGGLPSNWRSDYRQKPMRVKP